MISNGRFDRSIVVSKTGPYRAFVSSYARGSFFYRLIAAITLIAFITTTIIQDIAWADRTPSGLTAVGPDRAALRQAQDSHEHSRRAAGPGTFTIPAHLGTVKDAWYSETRPTIIHIQDAHCNYAAQRKIAEIVEYLNKTYCIDTVNLEGGARDYDLSVFTNIADKAVRDKTADHFVREGFVNGAEYFAINNPDKVSLWGIEDVGLYIDNLRVYRDSLRYKDEADRLIAALSRVLASLKTKTYSKDLLEFDSRCLQYKAGNLEFKSYLTYLVSFSKDSGVDTGRFTNIHVLSRIVADEDNVDFNKANAERDELINLLQRTASRKSLEELAAKTVEYRSGRVSQRDFYGYLVLMAALSGIGLKNFPELKKYINYITTYETTDKIKMMAEMTALEGAIKERLFQNDIERRLDTLSRNLAVLKDIFGITLTREDYRYYADNERSFEVSNFTSFIKNEAVRYGIKLTVLNDNFAKLDQYRKAMVRFYECSFRRDSAFINNLKFGNVAQRTTILVTGGFHTENLCAIFKRNNISYVSIIPNFTNGDGYKCHYYKILSGEKKIKLAEAVPSMLARSLLATPDQLSPVIMRAVEAEASRRGLNIPYHADKPAQAPIVENELETITLALKSLSALEKLAQPGSWH